MDDPDVNLTPLIDVVFVILVVFILIAPLLDVEKINLAPSKVVKDENSLELKEKSPLAIIVRKDNTVAVNGQTIAMDNLTAHLAKLKELHPYEKPQLFHDKEAFFGTFQAVKNAAAQAGFDELDLILKPK